MSGRESFAFRAPVPVEARAASTGQSRGAQVVGGRTQGGAVVAGQQTDPGAIAGGLGEFFGQLMQPYVERKQQEKFFEGFTAAAEGKAISELSDSGNPVTKIFGPSSYEQGAQFYTAQKAVTDWSQAQTADVDNLKKLDPAEVPKVLAERARAAMTGDPYADQMIQRSLIEQAGPMVSTIAKKRVEYQQQQAVIAQQGAWGSAAANLQTVMDAQAGVTDPTDPRSVAASQATTNFLGMFVKPEGMTDDSYKRGLKGALRAAAQSGQFHAITALRKAGIDGIFDDDESAKLEDMYHRYGQRAMSEAAPRLLQQAMDDYSALYAKGRMTPTEARNKLLAMNATMRAHTGVDEDMFDFNEIKGEVRSLSSLIVANHWRAVERGWQLEDRQFAADQRARDRAQDNADESHAVGLAWASGEVASAIVGGLPTDKFQQKALQDWAGGNLGNITKAFRTSQWVSSALKDRVQAGISSSLDEQYGQSMQTVYGQWKNMVAANPGMAASYYGEWHQKLRAFDTLQKQLGPAAAYKRAFGDSSMYSDSNIAPEKRKQAREAIDAAVGAQQPGRVSSLFGAFRLNSSALGVVRGIAEDRVALGLQNSDTPAAVLAPEAINAAKADGSLQMAGRFAWRAPVGTTPFHTQLSLLPDEAGRVFEQVVDQRLKARGVAKGVDADGFTIAYMKNPQGVNGVGIMAHSKDGSPPAHIWVAMSDFRAQQVQNMHKPLAAEDMHRELEARGLSSIRSRDTHGRLPANWQSLPVKFPKFLDRSKSRQQWRDYYIEQHQRENAAVH